MKCVNFSVSLAVLISDKLISPGSRSERGNSGAARLGHLSIMEIIFEPAHAGSIIVVLCAIFSAGAWRAGVRRAIVVYNNTIH